MDTIWSLEKIKNTVHYLAAWWQVSEGHWESVNIIAFGNILGKHSVFHSFLFCTCMSHYYTSTNVWKWKLISKNFNGASVKWILIATEKNKSRNFAVIYASPFAVCLLCVRRTSLTSQRQSLCPEHTHRLATKTNWTSNYMNKLLNYTILSARRVSVLTRKEQQISRSWEIRLL